MTKAERGGAGVGFNLSDGKVDERPASWIVAAGCDFRSHYQGVEVT